jgi:CheY-like chemotaxis protein
VEVKISVQDTGIGMKEEDLSRLFTAFNQADASTARRFGGTGLGLAISRQFVELMGGTIQAESTPGKGSLFTVVLSFLIDSGVGRTNLLQCPDTRRIRFTDARALVVEDHEINREIVIELLWRAGIKADIATNGMEAVEMVRASDYDILFMDISMPEMDGLTATKEIRNLGKEGIDHLPIIALSSHAIIGDREESLAAGMNDHLAKPINPDTLEAALLQWLPPEKRATVAADELYLFTKQKLVPIQPPAGLEVELGSAEELHPLLEQLKLALASEEPLPCMKILEDLSQRRWSESYETALAEVNRLVQQYLLAEALAFLDKEFDDVINYPVHPVHPC